VLAVDNDPEAVRVADKHRDINKIPDTSTDMRCRCGEGFAEETLQRRKPFDLIIANILPGALKDMAADLAAASDENAAVILSGILHEQAQNVLEVYKDYGLELRKTIKIDKWSTLVLRKAAA
jgi:ribosomal protein L11 methyltransferase